MFHVEQKIEDVMIPRRFSDNTWDTGLGLVESAILPSGLAVRIRIE